jgi:apolipoprotein N-acyltransferase
MEEQATVMEDQPAGAAPRPAFAQTLVARVRQVPTDRVRLAAAALVTSGLLWLSYFPVNWGWLAWGALVPLLTLLRAHATFRFRFLWAWLSGLAFFVPVLWWMHAADGLQGGIIGPMTTASYALGVYCALYFPAAIFLVRRLDRLTPLPLALTLPVVWTGLEFFRSFFGTGFAWYFLSHTQHAFLGLIQISDLAGAYAVTFLVVAVNALIFEWLCVWPWLRARLTLSEPTAARPWRRNVLQTLAVAGLIVAALAYGDQRLSENTFEPGPRLALLQGNLEQRIRNQATSTAEHDEHKQAREQVIRSYATLCDLASRLSPDLIVWPETSFPADWFDTAPDLPLKDVPDEWFRKRYLPIRDALLKQWVEGRFHRSLLLGLNTRELVAPDKEARYNSALLVRYYEPTPEKPRGEAIPERQRYDKIHRVPFGEYVPFRDWLPFMDVMSPYDFDYSIRRGSKLTRFALGKHTFGTFICFEDGDPDLARQYGVAGSDGPAADFLIELSNDGWFDGTAEHEQHLAICRFRAIEARRSVARAVNMGISAVIDGNGRVLVPESDLTDGKDLHVWEIGTSASRLPDLPTSRWHDFKKVQGVLVASMPLDRRTSLYARWGDWLPLGCWLLVGAGLIATRFGGRNRAAPARARGPKPRIVS